MKVVKHHLGAAITVEYNIKQQQAAEITRHIEAFKKQGGKIEVLGVTQRFEPITLAERRDKGRVVRGKIQRDLRSKKETRQ